MVQWLLVQLAKTDLVDRRRLGQVHGGRGQALEHDGGPVALDSAHGDEVRVREARVERYLVLRPAVRGKSLSLSHPGFYSCELVGSNSVLSDVSCSTSPPGEKQVDSLPPVTIQVLL